MIGEDMLAEKRRQGIIANRVAMFRTMRRSITGTKSDLHREVRRALDLYGIPPTRFGREAANDPAFVFDLERGREPRAKVKARIRAYIAALSLQQTGAAHG